MTAAKLEMARGRQKLMALMVMLGINRIIVTNGRINAKVVFDITASDYAKRMAKAGMTDVAESQSGGFAIYRWRRSILFLQRRGHAAPSPYLVK